MPYCVPYSVTIILLQLLPTLLNHTPVQSYYSLRTITVQALLSKGYAQVEAQLANL